MGKTSKPVRILVLDEDLFNSPEVQALIEKGHPITAAYSLEWPHTGPADYGLILGRAAWHCDTPHLKYLEKIAIPHARAAREKAKT